MARSDLLQPVCNASRAEIMGQTFEKVLWELRTLEALFSMSLAFVLPFAVC